MPLLHELSRAGRGTAATVAGVAAAGVAVIAWAEATVEEVAVEEAAVEEAVEEEEAAVASVAVAGAVVMLSAGPACGCAATEATPGAETGASTPGISAGKVGERCED